jgi:hypothetical protein
MGMRDFLVETAKMVGQSRDEKPVRRLLRWWSVTTLLASAGLLLSVAALLIVIGIGEVQITAAAGGSGSLFANAWFDVGAVVAAIGILCGLAAIATIGSQSKALREFPALEIEIIAGGFNPTTLPEGMTTSSQWLSQLIGVRITNRELTRGASLAVRLRCVLTPGFGNETEIRMRSTWQDSNYVLGGSLDQLRSPVALEPQQTIEGFLVFDFANVSPHLTDDRKLELLDHNCGRSVNVSTGLGQVHDFT